MESLLATVSPVSDRVAEAIARRTGGNPFFATELLTLLRQMGELGEEAGRLSLSRGAEPGRWPKTLDRTVLLRARGTLTRFGNSNFVERVLEYATVLGGAFDYDLLVDFLVRMLDDRQAIEGAIEALLQAGLFEESRSLNTDALRFAHPVLRAALLSDLTQRGGLIDLHRNAATALVNHTADATGASDLRIARHYEAGEDAGAAAGYLCRAARYARDEGHHMRALELLEEADGLLADVDSDGAALQRASLWLELAEVEILCDGFARSKSLVARVHSWSVENGDRELTARACLVLAHLCEAQGRPEQAKTAYKQAQKLFDHVRDYGGVGESQLGLAGLARHRGDIREAMRLLNDALVVLDRVGARKGMGQALQGMGEIAMIHGQYGDARTSLRRAISHFRDAGEERREADCQLLLGEATRLLGIDEESLRHFEEARRSYASLGDGNGVGRSHLSLARLLADGNSWPEAVAHYRCALAAWRGAEHGEKTANVWEEIGLKALALGDFELAAEGIEAAVTYAIGGDAVREVVLRATLAWVEAERGDLHKSDREIRSALSTNAGASVLDDDFARALAGLGEVEKRIGNTERAAYFLGLAAAQYASVGNVAEANRLQALLD